METVSTLALMLGVLLGVAGGALFFSQRARATAEELRRLRGGIEVLTRDLAVASALAQATRAQLADATTSSRAAVEELSRAQSEHSTRLALLREERATLDQELVAVRTTITERQRQVQERDEQLRDATERLRISSADVDAIRHALGEAKATCAKLEQRTADYAKKEAEIAQLREASTTTQKALNEQARRLAVLELQVEDDQRLAEEKLKTLQVAKVEMEETFKGIAAQVLQQNTEKFEANTKVRLGELLQPLGERIKEFEAKVQDTHKRDIEDRSVLHAEIKRVVSASQKLDQDAVNLTKALKGDAQVQGAWGEVVLERILEQSGLREGTEYERQATFIGDDDTRLRPDVVVRLPGGRAMVVDSKVSLSAYAEAVATTVNLGAEAMRRHMDSVRAHIKQLSAKEYWRINSLDTGDYVLMFIPIESAFADTVKQDNTLFEAALQRNVIISSPSTLLAALRTIEHTWRVERQNETARAVMDQASKLYDKFCAFVEELEKVGVRLRQAQTAHDGAMNKLRLGRGNLVRQVEQLRGLGLKGKKALPHALSEDVDSMLCGGLLLAEASASEPTAAGDHTDSDCAVEAQTS